MIKNMFKRKTYQKVAVIVTNGKGQNLELSEALIKKFDTSYKKWRTFAISPAGLKGAT
jgi:hypothetical protein